MSSVELLRISGFPPLSPQAESVLGMMLDSFGDVVSTTILADRDEAEVRFATTREAQAAFDGLAHTEFDGATLHVRLGTAACHVEMATLAVPLATKMFLISPPPSPPVGWVQSHEAPPVPDQTLMHAVAAGLTAHAVALATGPLQLVPARASMPAIVVEDTGAAEDAAEREAQQAREAAGRGPIPFRRLPPPWLQHATQRTHPHAHHAHPHSHRPPPHGAACQLDAAAAAAAQQQGAIDACRTRRPDFVAPKRASLSSEPAESDTVAAVDVDGGIPPVVPAVVTS